MTNIYDKKHFRDALKKAKELNGESKKSFLDCIKYLNIIKRENKKWILFIYPDIIEYSFSFLFRDENQKKVIDGTIIFQVENINNYRYWKIYS